jgi:hypothetical protein
LLRLSRPRTGAPVKDGGIATSVLRRLLQETVGEPGSAPGLTVHAGYREFDVETREQPFVRPEI